MGFLRRLLTSQESPPSTRQPLVRFRSLGIETLEQRTVLAAVDWVLGDAADFTVLMTDQSDTLIAGAWVDNNNNGVTVLGLWESQAVFDQNGGPARISATLASAITKISVTARGGSDIVDLSHMSLLNFSNLASTYIKGDAGNDTLTGTFTPDEIRGDDDQDTIDGGAGPDVLYGGPQNDTIRGGDGMDYIEGSQDNDTIYGGADRDIIKGNAGSDTIYGEGGADDIQGGSENDWIYGGADGDELRGDAGEDWIEGGSGNDVIDGGADKDILWSGIGAGVDQPWNGNGEGTAGWNDMKGTGPATDGACDLEDNHPECANTGPTPVDEAYTVNHNSFVLINAPGVLANDMPIPGDTSALTVSLKYWPSHAQFKNLQADGTLYYDPVNNFAGTDYFYYRVSQSGIEGKRLGIVTITVTNVAPTVNNDSAMTAPNTPVTVEVGSNDTDADGDFRTVIITANPAHGTLTIVASTTNPGTQAVTYTTAIAL